MVPVVETVALAEVMVDQMVVVPVVASEEVKEVTAEVVLALVAVILKKSVSVIKSNQKVLLL